MGSSVHATQIGTNVGTHTHMNLLLQPNYAGVSMSRSDDPWEYKITSQE